MFFQFLFQNFSIREFLSFVWSLILDTSGQSLIMSKKSTKLHVIQYIPFWLRWKGLKFRWYLVLILSCFRNGIFFFPHSFSEISFTSWAILFKLSPRGTILETTTFILFSFAYDVNCSILFETTFGLSASLTLLVPTW